MDTPNLDAIVNDYLIDGEDEITVMRKVVESAREELAALKSEHAWRDASVVKPDKLTPVLVTGKGLAGQKFTTLAEYIPPRTVLEEDYIADEYIGEECAEYDDEKDCYWVKEGWFEYAYVAEIHYSLLGFEITHWMPIPEAK